MYYGNIYDASATKSASYTPAQVQSIYGMPAAYKKGLDGTGQTIVLLEAFGYPTMQQDANAFSTLAGLPQLSSSNFQIVYPDGQSNPQLGIQTGWNLEIALDVEWAHTIASGAKIVVVVSNGQDSKDFQRAMRYIVNHNLGYGVSDSWEEDTDYYAGPLEQKSFDQVLTRAAAKGISFQFSTGDHGDDGLGTPVGAAGVPADSPLATVVGGTSVLNVVGGSGTTTTGWGTTLTLLALGNVENPPAQEGAEGGAGGGESMYFAKPSWQSALPGTGRQTPDVSALADPYTGVPIVLTQNGEQIIQPGIGGTSLASPIFTAIWAIADQEAGHPLGQAAPTIAALPAGALLDVLPATSQTDVSGVMYDANGSTFYSASQLFSNNLYSKTSFLSAVWNLGSGEYGDLGFGLNTSLTLAPGWDNVTGFGTPTGLTSLNAVAKSQ